MTRSLTPNRGKTTKGPSTSDTKRASTIKGSDQMKKGQPGLKGSSLHSKGQGFTKPR